MSNRSAMKRARGESFASLTLSDGEEDSRRNLEEVTIHEKDIDTVQEDPVVSDVYSSK